MSAALHGHWSLSQIVTLLQHEFPEVTISKIRFMESQGLISPERTPSGYRHFYQGDYERLHWILVQQRDSYLPLRVIRDRLNSGERLPAVSAPDVEFAEPEFEPEEQVLNLNDPMPEHEIRSQPESARVPPVEARQALQEKPRAKNARIDWASELDETSSRSSGRQPKSVSGKPSDISRGAVSAAQPLYTRLTALEGTQASLGLDVPEPPRQEPEPPRLPGMSLSMRAEELATTAGVDPNFVAELTRFGVIAPSTEAGSAQYSNDTLEIVRLASQFAQFGLEPRHMRTILLSAEREVELYTQTVGAGLRAGNAESRRQAHRNLGELATMAASMRAVMIKRMLRTLTP